MENDNCDEFHPFGTIYDESEIDYDTAFPKEKEENSCHHVFTLPLIFPQDRQRSIEHFLLNRGREIEKFLLFTFVCKKDDQCFLHYDLDETENTHNGQHCPICHHHYRNHHGYQIHSFYLEDSYEIEITENWGFFFDLSFKKNIQSNSMSKTFFRKYVLSFLKMYNFHYHRSYQKY